MHSLIINNLSVAIDNQPIIQNLSLTLQPGSIHALMGPNGSGKSTLAYTIMGHPRCVVTGGSIQFNGQDITDLPVEKRAKLGIFLAFQQPLEVPGLQIFTFLKETYTAFTGKQISAFDFTVKLDAALALLELSPSFVLRGLNEGFSGGERKRLEMLQLLLLEPQLIILDEIDSGLDVDALRIVAHALQECKKRNPLCTVILVTHYQRILDYIQPDRVHVVASGAIAQTGDYLLAHTIEKNGYGQAGL